MTACCVFILRWKLLEVAGTCEHLQILLVAYEQVDGPLSKQQSKRGWERGGGEGGGGGGGGGEALEGSESGMLERKTVL